MSDQNVAVGRIVHFVMPDGKTHRPAIVVQVWSPECAQLQVFLDGHNEECNKNYYGTETPTDAEQQQGMAWRTSVTHDEDGKKSRTWHWPERD